MTKGKKIIIAISLVLALILTILFFFVPRKSNVPVVSLAPPREVTPVRLPAPVPSMLAVKVELPLHEVKQFAESAIANYLRDPIQWKDGKTTLTLNLRPENLGVTSTTNGAVSIEIPLQIRGSARFPVDLLITEIHRHGTLTGHATAVLTLTPTLYSDWNFTVETQTDISVQAADITIRGIFSNRTISIRENFIQEGKKTVLPEIEEKIAKYIDNIDLKGHAVRLWKKLHEPICLNLDPRVVLTTAPLEILVQNLSSDGLVLSLILGIRTFIHVNVEGTPTDSPAAGVVSVDDLPEMRFVDSLHPGYHITTRIEAPYAVLEDLARPYVEKTHALQNIIVENLTIYGSGTQLAAAADFTMPLLGATGEVSLLGTPMSDATTVFLSVTELRHTFTRESLIVEIANRTGDGIFGNLHTTVEAESTFQITALYKKLSEMIAYYPIGSRVVLQGTLDTLTPEPPYLTQTGVFIPFRLQGALDCEIHLNSRTPQTP